MNREEEKDEKRKRKKIKTIERKMSVNIHELNEKVQRERHGKDGESHLIFPGKK